MLDIPFLLSLFFLSFFFFFFFFFLFSLCSSFFLSCSSFPLVFAVFALWFLCFCGEFLGGIGAGGRVCFRGLIPVAGNFVFLPAMSKNVAVIGGGSWATAIAKILLNNQEELHWWVREPEILEGLRREGINPMYLSGVEFPIERLHVSNDIRQVVDAADTLVMVVPAVYLPGALQCLETGALQGKGICSAIKGIIPGHDQVVCEYLRDAFGVPEENLAAISGPSHAEEIALNRLTYLTAASRNSELAEHIARLFSCEYVRTRCSDDVYGIEYAAVMKNVYALAVGIAKGLGYGDNFVSVLVSNALEEMRVFLEKVHDIKRNLNSASYLGDLLVTSYSQFSRNRTFGNMIGQGYSVKSAILEMKMVAEGYYASGSVHAIKQNFQVAMPIFEAVHAVLYENCSPRRVFRQLEALFS